MNHKTYVTFGFNHKHNIKNKVFDRNCVAVIKSKDRETGRILAFELFNTKFCMDYPEKYFNHEDMEYYPRGFIEVN